MSWIVMELVETDGLVLGITTDNQDNIYFTRGYLGLWKLSKTLELECLVDRDGKTYMMGLVWNGVNTLYICDHMHGIVCYHLDSKKYEVLADDEGHQDGQLSSARFYRPWGITMDKDGILYVSEKQCVRKINMIERTVVTLAGTPINENEEIDEIQFSIFNNLTGIAIQGEDIFVCDDGNKCIFQIRKDGFISLLAGGTLGKGLQDETLLGSCLLAPHGLLMENQDTFWVADRSLRRIDRAKNRISTIEPNSLQDVLTVAMDRNGMLIMEANTGIDEYHLVKVVHMWTIVRLLWIGKLKEDVSNCMLARLPNELVTEIAKYLRTPKPKASKKTRKEQYQPKRYKKVRN